MTVKVVQLDDYRKPRLIVNPISGKITANIAIENIRDIASEKLQRINSLLQTLEEISNQINEE